MAGFVQFTAMVVDALHLAIIASASMISYYYVCYRARGRYKKQLIYTSAVALVSFALNCVVGRCPLTIASERLRQLADPSFTMTDGFIPYYLNDVLGLHLSLSAILILVYLMMVIPPVVTFLTLGYDGLKQRGV